MTPKNSHEVALSLSRDRLARALVRLDRLTRDAAETIAHIRAEKRDLENRYLQETHALDGERNELQFRLEELMRMFEQERSNFEQRAMLLQSVTAESEERGRSLEALGRRYDEQERLLQEQTEAIARLEGELREQASLLASRDSGAASLQSEIEEWKRKFAQSEERAVQLANERDSLRAQLYEHERQDAQWVLKLSSEERAAAARAIDSLIDQLSSMENRIAVEQRIAADNTEENA